MTLRQSFLKLVYPLLMWYSQRKKKRKKVLINEKKIGPARPFHSLSAHLNNGLELNFDSLKGKKVLLVNTASDCGYTNQYHDLQKLSEKYKNKLVIIGFPANDFKEQEKGSDEEIATFCQVNFGVTFPLAKKTTVINRNEQNPVFKWLSDKNQNGWNDKQPSWNFAKYLVDENGILVNYFDPAISPLSDEIIKAVDR